MKELYIEQRAYGIEHPGKWVNSLEDFDKKFKVGPWNNVVELKIRPPVEMDWSVNYRNTRKIVEEFFNARG